MKTGVRIQRTEDRGHQMRDLFLMVDFQFDRLEGFG